MKLMAAEEYLQPGDRNVVDDYRDIRGSAASGAARDRIGKGIRSSETRVGRIEQAARRSLHQAIGRLRKAHDRQGVRIVVHYGHEIGKRVFIEDIGIRL